MERRTWLVFAACTTVCLLWMGYQHVPTFASHVVASWQTYHPIPADMPTHQTKEWTKETMKIRGRTLRERCDITHGNTQGKVLRTQRTHPRIYVDDDHKFLICINNKVGSTNIVRILLALNGITKKSNPLDISGNDIFTNARYLKRLSQFTNEEEAFRLRNYKKYVFVREPFERLISAYNNKIKYGNDPRFSQTIAQIIDRIKPNGAVAFGKEYNISFSEFIQYILHPKTIKEGYNPHWATYSSMCNPCYIRYDGVGKIETFNKDMEVLLDDIGKTDVPIPHTGARPNASATLIEQYFRGISSDSIQQLKNVYANDSFLFDFEFPSFLRTLLNKV